MPLYTFYCRQCDRSEERYFTIAERETYDPVCLKCDWVMHRDFSAIRFGINTGDLDYTTSDINGQKVHVSTRKQEKALCEAAGVRRVSSDEIHVKRLPPKPREPMAEAFERKRQEMGVEL